LKTGSSRYARDTMCVVGRFNRKGHDCRRRNGNIQGKGWEGKCMGDTLRIKFAHLFTIDHHRAVNGPPYVVISALDSVPCPCLSIKSPLSAEEPLPENETRTHTKHPSCACVFLFSSLCCGIELYHLFSPKNTPVEFYPANTHLDIHMGQDVGISGIKIIREFLDLCSNRHLRTRLIRKRRIAY